MSQPGHLSDRQIHDCAITPPGGSSREIEAHLAECEACLGRLLEWQRGYLGIATGAGGMNPAPYENCPPESALQEVAAQFAPPEDSASILEHAAQCHRCGPLLNRYLQDFSEDIPPEVEAMIAQLPLSEPRWQREKAREIVHLLSPEEERVSFWRKAADGWAVGWFRAMAGATAMVLLTALGILRGPALLNLLQIHSASSLVSAAFVENGRDIEQRLTGVAHAPYVPPGTTLGPDDRPDDLKRPALNEAWSKLSQKQASGGELDPRWLQIKGRLLLLKNPNAPMAAAEVFQQARARGLKSLSLDLDLAACYFEYQSKSDSPDFSHIIHQLKDVVDSKSPEPTSQEKAVALFNLALAYEKTNAWDLAVATWEQYLEIEPSGGWADEARKRLSQDQAIQPKQHSYKDPAEFNRNIQYPEVANDVEQFQEIALGEWLPRAVAQPASDFAQATRNVAALFAERHSDPLWADLTRSATQADLPAVQALSAAFIANQNDRQGEALLKSREAARLFSARGNLPGELLARFQEVYAHQRRLEAADCLRQVDRLWPRVFATRYRWLQGQLALEKAICANLDFDFKSVEANVEISRNLAAESNFNFPELRLRIAGIDAGMKRLNYAYGAAWTEAVAGLNDYWRHPYSSERLYQFYTVMRLIAQDTNSLHAAEAFLRRSIPILESNAPDDVALKALLYMRFANLLWEKGEESAAEAEAQHARALLHPSSAVDGAHQAYTPFAMIELANFELRRQRPELALSAIQPIGSDLVTQDKFVQLDFYRARGDAELQLNQLDQAEQDYRRGIRLVESSFSRAQVDEAERLDWVAATDRIYRGMVQILLARGRSEEALLVWEGSKSRFLDRHARSAGLLQVSAQTGKPRLPLGTTPRLIFASFTDRLQVWLVKDGRLVDEKSIPVPRVRLLRLVADFNQNCKDPSSPIDEIQKQAAGLYDLLLAPMIARLGSSGTVAVEFDSSIPAFAVEALRSPKGRYFGVDYAVLQSPGIFAENALRRPAPPDAHAGFLVVDASPAEGPGFLPGHQLPTAAILRAYPKATVLKGADLTLPNVEHALRGSDVLQIMSHGRRGNKGIALVLGPDLFLRPNDFSPELVGHLRLAVLAACSSGSSENGIFDANNLVRALLAGGVPHVIASHWNVDSQSTGRLFSGFYTHLKQGETEAEALRDARKDLLAPDASAGYPDHSHPYYWAAFNLTGRAD